MAVWGFVEAKIVGDWRLGAVFEPIGVPMPVFQRNLRR
jgi:hypothetical protein